MFINKLLFIIHRWFLSVMFILLASLDYSSLQKQRFTRLPSFVVLSAMFEYRGASFGGLKEGIGVGRWWREECWYNVELDVKWRQEGLPPCLSGSWTGATPFPSQSCSLPGAATDTLPPPLARLMWKKLILTNRIKMRFFIMVKCDFLKTPPRLTLYTIMGWNNY